MSKELIVVVTSVNVKKIDLKAYGMKPVPSCQVKVKVGDVEQTTEWKEGFDPIFEQQFTFPVENEETTKCYASFYMKGKDGDSMQIGDTQEYLLNLLKVKKPTFKGLIVPGGQVDMMFTAVNFGKEDVEEDHTASLMGLLDEGEGGMMMDDDE